MGNFVSMVDRYRIRYYGKSASGPKDLKAWLYLYGSGHKSGVVGTIGFYPTDVLETKQDQLDGLNRPQGHMCITEIGAVMDMLRNEKPIYIHWSESWKQVWLDTSSEPVGEEES